jgi:hypothetical protein
MPFRVLHIDLVFATSQLSQLSTCNSPQCGVPSHLHTLKIMSKLTRENAILPFPPNSDLTGKEGHIVSIQTNGNVGAVALYSVSGGLPPFGVVLLGSNAGEKTSVAISSGGLAGTIKVKLSAPVKAGEELQIDETGTVSPDSGSGNRIIVGLALEAGVADELIEAVLFRPVALT